MNKKNKRRLTFGILFISLLLIGVVLLVCGYVIAGYDILAMLSSQYAIWCYIAIGIVGFLAISLEVKDLIKRM